MSTPPPTTGAVPDGGAGLSVVKIFDLNAETMENDGLTATKLFCNDVARPALTYGYSRPSPLSGARRPRVTYLLRAPGT